MSALLRIAKTEVLEHRRQPWMLFILGLNYLLFSVAFGAVFLFFEQANSNKQMGEMVREQLAHSGLELPTVLQLATSTCQSLLFTNLPLFVAVMTGTSVLQDRERGTLPFLLLAPVTRFQLLAGKLVGAMALPVVLHLAFVGVSSWGFCRLGCLTPFAHKFTGSAWLVAYVLGAPASAAAVGALGAIISARARDVRTSMQFTSFCIGLLSLGIGAALVDGLSQGAGLQGVFAGVSASLATAALVFGARIVSREFGA